jgi:hypothetical protein
MLRGLHERLLSYWYEVGCPGWPALRAACDGAKSRCPHGQRGAGARGLRRSVTVGVIQDLDASYRAQQNGVHC